MSDNKCFKTSIGGQAVIEGVMMRGPEKIAVSVRKPDNEIETDIKDVSSFVQKYKLTKIPVIRGIFAFFDSMVTGTKCLMWSANFYADVEGDDSYKPSKFETWLDNKFGDKITDIVVYFSVVIALIFSLGLFVFLPQFLTTFVKNVLSIDSHIVANLLEGVVRISIFLIYLTLVSNLKDIRRTFEYHGAEHKTIACYESGEELTVENARKHTRLHPRCGTSFLLIVMVISIVLFSFTGWQSNIFARMAIRLLLMPIVAGLSYEIIKWAGRSECGIVKYISAPGMALQYITTREPDDSQLEVAITSLKAVLPSVDGSDKW